MESDFEKLEGVTDVISGFTGGTLKNPIYNGNHHGHYEAVEITYDPDVVSYSALLEYYWVNIDPFDVDGLSDAMQRAITLPLEERRERWSAMMETLKKNDISAWRDNFLAELEQATTTLGGV